MDHRVLRIYIRKVSTCGDLYHQRAGFLLVRERTLRSGDSHRREPGALKKIYLDMEESAFIAIRCGL